MKISDLFEAPYLTDEELNYQVLAKISKTALDRAYSKFSTIDDLIIYSKHTTGFIAGFMRDDHLSTVVVISCRLVSYPVVPKSLTNYQQVSMVNVSKEFAETGKTKLVYNQIAKQVDLVSDHEQYLGAKGLWKSLARDSDVNVYVFDGTKKDYIRDDDNNIINYNSTNIDDGQIWGNSESFRNILLVATMKELR